MHLLYIIIIIYSFILQKDNTDSCHRTEGNDKGEDVLVDVSTEMRLNLNTVILPILLHYFNSWIIYGTKSSSLVCNM